MKQFVRGGALAAWTWVLMTGCGSDPGTSTGGMTVTPPAAGTAAAPATSPAGSGAKAGTTAPSTGGVMATAGSIATSAGTTGGSAGGATAAAGTSAAGATAAAGSGTAGVSAAAGSGAGAAGTKGAAGSGGGGAAAGCGSESFAAIYETILKNTTYNCAGPLCHGREAGNVATVGDLSLSSASVAYMQLTAKTTASMSCAGKTRVVPGDPAASLLVQKLRGDTTMCGGVMPIGADEISEADLKRVTDWIKGGACNN